MFRSQKMQEVIKTLPVRVSLRAPVLKHQDRGVTVSSRQRGEREHHHRVHGRPVDNDRAELPGFYRSQD